MWAIFRWPSLMRCAVMVRAAAALSMETKGMEGLSKPCSAMTMGYSPAIWFNSFWVMLADMEMMPSTCRRCTALT